MSGPEWTTDDELDLVELALQDPLAAVRRLEEFDDDTRIPVYVAVHVAVLCYKCQPSRFKKPGRTGRPPLSLQEWFDRILDGQRSYNEQKLSKVREKRDVSRCRAAYLEFKRREEGALPESR